MSIKSGCFSAGEYLAPKFKVMEVKTRKVICLSTQNAYSAGYSNEEYEWDE